MTPKKHHAQVRADVLPPPASDATLPRHSARITENLGNLAGSLPSKTIALTDPAVCAVLIAVDWLVIFASSMAAWLVYHQLFGSHLINWRFYLSSCSLLATIFVLNGLRSSVYGFLWGVDRQERIVKVFRSFLQAYMLFVTLLVLAHWADMYSRVTLVLQFAFCSISILALRSFQFSFLQGLRGSRRIASTRVILLGAPGEMQAITRSWQERGENVEVIERFAVTSVSDEKEQEAVISDVAGRVVAKSRERNVDRIVILLPFEQRKIIDRLVERFLELPASILVSTESLIAMHGQPSMLTFGGMNMMRIVRRPMSATDRIVKRVFDFAVASILLVVTSPLLLAVALATWMESGGPIFFRQRRKGFNQKEFNIYKFRTMRVQPRGGGFSQTSRNDSRITRVGRFLRRWNLDELPQLINVVKGEMSLVGPRPHAVEHDEMYYPEIAAYARRHNMKPGITGLAQALGFRGATETVSQMEDRVKHDLIYIQTWSLLLDLKILLMTVFSPNAYRNAF